MKVNFSFSYVSSVDELETLLLVILILGPRLAKKPFPTILLVTGREKIKYSGSHVGPAQECFSP